MPMIPLGTCLFCGAQNDEMRKTCASCGRPLVPRPGETS